jgi:hypothetical protein
VLSVICNSIIEKHFVFFRPQAHHDVLDAIIDRFALESPRSSKLFNACQDDGVGRRADELLAVSRRC